MSKAKEPVECAACHKMIEIGQTIVKHHITYFPEKIVKVHGRCHGLIHKSKTMFPELKPDPRQTVRWYKKKGVTFWTWDVYAHEYYWLNWIDCVENGFMTEERKEKIQEAQLRKFWDEVHRVQQIEIKMNVKQDWSSSDILAMK